MAIENFFKLWVIINTLLVNINDYHYFLLLFVIIELTFIYLFFEAKIIFSRV